MTRRLSIAFVVLTACVLWGGVGGRLQANRAIARNTNRIDRPDEFRRDVTVKGITGGVLFGSIWAVLAFAIMQLLGKAQRSPGETGRNTGTESGKRE